MSHDPMKTLFENADDPAWQALIGEAERWAPVQQTVEPEVYAACFNTPAGHAVLEDMYRRYVNVTRCAPGQGTDAAFYREGMAQVVFDIVSNITQAHGGDDG